MNRKEIASYFDHYCRFKLRSGKEVFGVIWENAQGNTVHHYFASVIEHSRLKNQEEKAQQKTPIPVNIEEIIKAEIL